jgi:hypothetical protein
LVCIFTIFLQFSKIDLVLAEKEKEKSMNSTGRIPAQVGPSPGKMRTSPRPRRQFYTEISTVLNNSNQVLCTIAMSRWQFLKRSMDFYSFTPPDPRRRRARPSSSELLDRPNGARVGASERSTPNSSSEECFPSTNFWIGALQFSAHGDREPRGHSLAFMTTQGGLAQLDRFTSNKGLNRG